MIRFPANTYVVERQTATPASARANAGIVSREARAASEPLRFQRRLFGFPVVDRLNVAFYLDGLKKRIFDGGGSPDQFKQLKRFLKRGTLSSAAPSRWGRDNQLDCQLKINLAGKGITQEDIDGVQGTLGMLKGVVELDLTGNQIDWLPDLRGMTSLRVLTVDTRTTIDPDILPDRVEVRREANSPRSSDILNDTHARRTTKQSDIERHWSNDSSNFSLGSADESSNFSVRSSLDDADTIERSSNGSSNFSVQPSDAYPDIDGQSEGGFSNYSVYWSDDDVDAIKRSSNESSNFSMHSLDNAWDVPSSVSSSVSSAPILGGSVTPR